MFDEMADTFDNYDDNSKITIADGDKRIFRSFISKFEGLRSVQIDAKIVKYCKFGSVYHMRLFKI